MDKNIKSAGTISQFNFNSIPHGSVVRAPHVSSFWIKAFGIAMIIFAVGVCIIKWCA